MSFKRVALLLEAPPFCASIKAELTSVKKEAGTYLYQADPLLLLQDHLQVQTS